MTTRQIGPLMAAVMADVDAVGKTRRNDAQRYTFRGIDDFSNALHPVLSKHGVVLRPHVVEAKPLESYETKSGGTMFRVSVVLDLAFVAPDGSEHVVRTAGEGADTGDKATNKAMSAALKYALIMTFLVPTEERVLVDSEEDSHEARRRPPKGRKSEPLDPEERALGGGPPPGAEAQDLREQIDAVIQGMPGEAVAGIKAAVAKAGEDVERLKKGLAFAKQLAAEAKKK